MPAVSATNSARQKFDRSRRGVFQEHQQATAAEGAVAEHFLSLESLSYAKDVDWRTSGRARLLASICRRLGTGNFPVLAYAWNPLVIKEFAGSAHIDAVLIFFLMAALHNVRPRSSLFVAIATLVKPTPLVFLPALYKRLGWLGILLPAGALALIVAAPPEGMNAYAAYWTFNPALPRLLPVCREVELAFLAFAVAAAAFIADRRDDGSPQGVFSQGLWLFGAFLLCTPMLAPWYVTWILPFAAIRRAWFWLALSGSVFLSYHAYLRMEENIWLVLLEFSVPLAVWLGVRNRSG